MLTSQQAIKKYGDPSVDQKSFERKWMIMHDVGDHINKANPVIPNRVYINKDFAPVLENWLNALLEANVLNEIRTWDGIFNVRKKRGLSSLSLHSFAVAVDVNASHNPLGLTRQQAIVKGLKPFSEKFITISQRWVDAGALWTSRPDGMHFQLKNI